jgi:hypothetical protein
MAQTYTGGPTPSFPGGVLNPPGGTVTPPGAVSPVPGQVGNPVPGLVGNPAPGSIGNTPVAVGSSQAGQVLAAQVDRTFPVLSAQSRAGGLALTGSDVVTLLLFAASFILAGAVISWRARPNSSPQK